MAVFPGTFIQKGASSSAKMNHLIDNLMTPRLLSFRQICIYDEQATLTEDGLSWRVNWGNWLTAAPVKVRKNGGPFSPITDVDPVYGTFKAGVNDNGLDGRARDTVEVDYCWDYFPVAVLEGLYHSAMSIVNMTAVGPPTYYTIDTAPKNWEGVITDVAFAMCMERLLLDYDLWRYRLVFAVGPNDVYAGGGDVVGQLETLKQNAEQRAEKAMDNEKFKVGNYLAPPTSLYYASIRGGGGSSSAHGIPFLTGRLRGWKPNRIM
jgi:hypothetical protein